MTKHITFSILLVLTIVACSSAPKIAPNRLPEPVAPSDTLEQFGYEMSYFYLAPSQGAFDTFQRRADHFRGELEGAGNGADILVAVMIARISAAYGWPISSREFGARANEILEGRSPFARYIFDDSMVDPTKLDVWWASFFATGDDLFLEKVFQYAGWELPEHDIGGMMIIGAATWSFKANCRQHQRVLEFAKRTLQSPAVADRQKAFLRECIAYAESGNQQGESAAPL